MLSAEEFGDPMKTYTTDLHFSSAAGACIAATGDESFVPGDQILVHDEDTYVATVVSASKGGSTHVLIDFDAVVVILSWEDFTRLVQSPGLSGGTVHTTPHEGDNDANT